MRATSALINSFCFGLHIGSALYGIELTLYFKTINILLKKKGEHKKFDIFYAIFSTSMVCLVTFWVVSHVTFGERMRLLSYRYPGGAVAYWEANIEVWYMHLSVVTAVILQLMTDGLMIYRCRVIWNSYRAIIFLVILWFAALTLGALVGWTTGLPGGDFYSGPGASFSLAYWTVSVFLNTTSTCMICYRAVRYGKKVQECLGREYASLYFDIATTIIESVFPYTLSGIALLILLGVSSPVSPAFVSTYVFMMCISPQMLILRVVSGKAWRCDTFDEQKSTIKFENGPTSDLQRPDIVRAGAHVHTPSNVHPPDGDRNWGMSQV